MAAADSGIKVSIGVAAVDEKSGVDSMSDITVVVAVLNVAESVWLSLAIDCR